METKSFSSGIRTILQDSMDGHAKDAAPKSETLELRERLRAMQSENQRLKRSIAERQIERDDSRVIAASQQTLVESLKELQMRTTQNSRDYKAERDQLAKQLDESLRKLRQSEDELDRTRRKQESRDETREAQNNKHEFQLRGYAKLLGSVKEDLNRACHKLADELRASKTLHPLKDTLALTHFEISRIETQLLKLTTGSVERASLEATLRQFFEQRDFLKPLIEASGRELSAQAAVVAQLAEKNRVEIVIPPPPPSAKKAGGRIF
ncbi:MAG: hypothetical protein ABIR96_09365 [Bdellovibrionota bacterium]